MLVEATIGSALVPLGAPAAAPKGLDLGLPAAFVPWSSSPLVAPQSEVAPAVVQKAPVPF